MPDSSITKRALAEAMKTLMKQYPMEKIKIGDIVALCNMNRQSFYYHFKDKYDLVNWIYYTEFFEGILGSSEEPDWGMIERICDFFYENKVFYSNALRVRGQNSFSEYFNEVIHPLIRAHFDTVYRNDPNQEFYATFFADSIRISITRWLLEGAQQTPQEFVTLIKKAATGFAYKLIEDEEQSSEPN
ncbi:MAG: TetR/AcrR family transcriptional regulator C-terminal domain-containing protein [Anaerofustis sp.]